MITEAEQREAYEFIRPELKGHPEWRVVVGAWGTQWAEWIDKSPMVYLPYLYGWPYCAWSARKQPNMNTWCYEFVPRLKEANVNVSFNLMGEYEWWLPKNNDDDTYGGKDPYAAFSQWREVFQC